jgi:hypothetical protein
VAGPLRKDPFEGKTAIRLAFENAWVPAGPPSPLARRILKILRGRAGTFRANGWRVLRGDRLVQWQAEHDINFGKERL